MRERRAVRTEKTFLSPVSWSKVKLVRFTPTNARADSVFPASGSCLNWDFSAGENAGTATPWPICRQGESRNRPPLAAGPFT
jgi:hypothetical protein